MKLLAEGVTVSLNPAAFTLSLTAFSSTSVMASRSFLSSCLKKTCASILLMNSGGNTFLTAFSRIILRLTDKSFPPVVNPTPLPYSSISRLPTLEVIMRIVFLKLTVLPVLSVSLPSSSTCNRRLNMSGWAFSISSSNTTEYGFLLTLSLS